jgi:hypothetical protein
VATTIQLILLPKSGGGGDDDNADDNNNYVEFYEGDDGVDYAIQFPCDDFQDKSDDHDETSADVKGLVFKGFHGSN